MDNDTDIHNNTASTAGGGAPRPWGTFNGYNDASDVYANCAPDGGGFSVNNGALLMDNAVIFQNQAAGPRPGGAIQVVNGGEVYPAQLGLCRR